MDCITQRIPYRQTGSFSNIVLDYLDHSDGLKAFYTHPSTLQGIQNAIEARKKFPVNRDVLVQELSKQYVSEKNSEAIEKSIKSLLSENTFTITTAHQPNIFTGPLYFIHKILHTIKLAEHFGSLLPSYKFVPVYYMGSEDADLDELGHTYLDGQKIEWETKQTGAVGRMKVDKEFIKLIQLIEGQLKVQAFGNEIIDLVKNCYKEKDLIQDGTFRFVNALFAQYGLIVLIADTAAFKKQMTPVFEDDLLNQAASAIVEKTSKQLGELYKVQINPREINLFYLKDNIRERIVETKEGWAVMNGTKMKFSKSELLEELNTHPERFSPNVVLRGLYQETILPNIVFTGGGGELAYWLQLKELFNNYKVPFPVLLLRNSFLFVEKKWQEKISKLGFTIEDFFLPEQELINRLVARETNKKLQLNGTFSQTESIYDLIKKQASAIDITLAKHVDSLKIQTLHRLQELEKKMLRAEKRKFTDQQRQIHTIKEKLFPGNGLQERHDNFMPYYAKWGREFIKQLYQHSLNLEQEFVTLIEK
ncbi:MAG: bacillithiol biosynthesis cysteine-adding enzyme BshC [Bacteroidia bacterium]|nr:bacillithiol biosynthesis cysteine-adding enzyme BshC [Bacteroidia bacterium]